MDSDISKIYKENNFPSRKRLYEILRENKIKATYKQVSEFVDRQAINQLHKPTRVIKKHSLSVVAAKVNDCWQIDLLDYSKYSTRNRGFKWLFICVDVFTRRAFVEPIKSKRPTDTEAAFKKIVAKGGKPEWVYHDQGNEWMGSFRLFCEIEGIVNLTNLLHEHTSLSIIDRFSLTIKREIEKYMSAHNTTSFLGALPQLVEMYNNSPHSGIEHIKPIEVADNPENLLIVANLNADKQERNYLIQKRVFNKIKMGDSVRIQVEKGTFTKGYKITYSTQIYKVASVRGNVATLDNKKEYKIDKLLVVPPETVAIDTTKKDKAEKQIKDRRRFLRELG